MTGRAFLIHFAILYVHECLSEALYCDVHQNSEIVGRTLARVQEAHSEARC